MVLDGNLLIVSLLQRRNDDGKDGQPSAFAIPASVNVSLFNKTVNNVFLLQKTLFG